MNIWQAIISGILQGLTEFLPVSSSGHLVLAHHIFSLTEPQLFFDIVLHVATLIPIFIIFRQKIFEAFRNKENMFAYTALGTFVTFIVALPLKQSLVHAFESPQIVSIMLLLTGALLIITSQAQKKISAKYNDLNIWKVTVIGAAQAFAITPGISRSGVTICTALLLGIEPLKAINFSFLLSIPAILAAMVLAIHGFSGTILVNSQIISGFAAAAVTGYIALKILIKSVKKRKLSIFGFYCIIVGILSIILL